jgi:hypothetical protein
MTRAAVAANNQTIFHTGNFFPKERLIAQAPATDYIYYWRHILFSK